MFVYHPDLELRGRIDDDSCPTVIGSASTNQARFECGMLLDTLFAALFMIPRPAGVANEIGYLPTVANPLWAPVPYVMRCHGATEGMILGAHKSNRMQKYRNMIFRQACVRNVYTPESGTTAFCYKIKHFNNAFTLAFCNPDHQPGLPQERALNAALSNTVEYIAGNFTSSRHQHHADGISATLFTSIADNLLKRHMKLCALPATMPLQQMKALV